MIILYCYKCHCLLQYVGDDKDGNRIFTCPTCKYKVVYWMSKENKGLVAIPSETQS